MNPRRGRPAPGSDAALDQESGGTYDVYVAAKDRPPRLKINLISNLVRLALINMFPLGALIWLGTNYSLGKLGVREGSEAILPLVVLLLLAAMLILSATWLVLPTLRWGRRWSAWQIDHEAGSTLLGILALPLAWGLSLLTWLSLLVVTGLLILTIFQAFIAAQPALEHSLDDAMGPASPTE